jgi:hypothetical protein
MARQKRRRGQFCWRCGRVRANERFSGKGHARHLCKDCEKLGSAELEARQAQRTSSTFSTGTELSKARSGVSSTRFSRTRIPG